MCVCVCVCVCVRACVRVLRPGKRKNASSGTSLFKIDTILSG